MFTSLADRLSGIISDLGSITFEKASDGEARYIIEYEINLNDVPTPAGSYLIFIKDVDGLWRIEFF